MRVDVYSYNFEYTKLTYIYRLFRKNYFSIFQVVCDLFKLKHVYILPIYPILNLRP